MKKINIITGASSGIGFEIAKLYARDGRPLFLISSNIEKLKNAKLELLKINKEIRIELYAIDLSESNSIYNVIGKTSKYEIETLINNAGFGEVEYFINTVNITKMINLNIVFLTEFTKYVSNKMNESSGGVILNVGSMLGVVSAPNQAVYAATKSYVNNLTKALYYEFKNTNVKISLITPNLTKETKFMEKSGMDESKITKVFYNFLSTPDKVAKKAYKNMGSKKIIYTNLSDKILAVIMILTPNFIITPIILKLMKTNK